MLRGGLSTLAARARVARTRTLSSAAKYPPEWEKRALKELRGKELSALEVTTPEGLKVKPVYTKDDVNYDNISQEPGVYPYTRGFVRLFLRGKRVKVAARQLERIRERSNCVLCAFCGGVCVRACVCVCVF